jgi:hypothetical protein
MGFEGNVATAKEDDMRRGLWIGVVLLLVAAGILIGVGAYHAGETHGIAEAGRASEVVRVVGYHGFPFGIIVFPLVIFGIFAIAGARRRRWAAMGPGGPGPWGGKWGYDQDAVREMHRRLHEQGSGDHPGSGGEAASV